MTIVPLRTSALRLPLRRASLLILILLVCFALSSEVHAVSPPPDGGYGGNNTAEGTNALFHLTTGVWNSAVGFHALYKDTSGSRNTALGFQALYNTDGPFNVSGLDNVAVGAQALFNNTTGSQNIAIGSFALYDNTTGSHNTAIGDHALWQLDDADGVTAIGDSFYSDPNDVEVGRRRDCDTDIVATATIHAYNIFIGDPEFFGNAPQSCSIRTGTQSVHIVVDQNVGGAVFVDGVTNHPITGSPVAIDASGQLGVQASSARFKKDIQPMDTTSEAILGLKPVAFRYKQQIDPNGVPQFGLVAEDVEKVNPDLVVRDKEGKPYTVRYEAVNAMLLNEFIKEHRKVEKLEANAAEQQKEIKALAGVVKQQASLLEKVSSQLEASKVTPKIVANQ
jgi:trimeric autotransporter adhesin